jgi:hypothetical protein
MLARPCESAWPVSRKIIDENWRKTIQMLLVQSFSAPALRP